MSIKQDFKKVDNKDFIHFLIYLQIRGKNLNTCYFSKQKGFNKLMEKICHVLKLIKNKEKNMDYIRMPFPSVSEKEMIEILEKVKYNLENN